MEHNNKKVAEKQLEGLKTELAEMITQDPPTPVEDCLAAIKAKKTEFALADAELVKVSCLSQLKHTQHASTWAPVYVHILAVCFWCKHMCSWVPDFCFAHLVNCVAIAFMLFRSGCCCADHLYCAD